ncbi:UNVERIFIED_CONTAM: ABC transporter permease, partial [Mumia flava]
MRHPAVLAVASGFGALLVTVALAAAAGASPATTLSAMWTGTFGNPFALGSSMNTAAAILLIACGFIVAYRASLVNVGGEGQLCLGAIGATAVGTHLPDSTPTALAIPAVLVAAALGGAAWAAIPAALVVRRGVNEVITT